MPLGGRLMGWGRDYQGSPKVRQELPDGTIIEAASGPELEAQLEAHFEANPDSAELYATYQTKAAPNGAPERAEPDDPADGGGGGGA